MDLLTPFEGAWRLARNVDDRRAGARLAFEGRAVLTRRADGALAVEEAGRWTCGPWAGLSGSRGYLWLVAGAGIEVRFGDGRFFHRFAPAPAGEAACWHDCGADLYAGRYRFALPAEWQVVWHVSGPAKDYVMHTRHVRE